MGQTLTHGVYLPDEGERNCYNGLAANWQLLDNSVGTIADHTTALAGKAPAVHTHTKSDITDFPAYGNTAGTICEGNDARLSDARTPVAHTHTKSDVTDLFNSANIWTDTNTFSSTLKQVNSTITKGTIPQSDTLAFDVYWGGTGVSSLNNALFSQRGYVYADGSTAFFMYALENVPSGTHTSFSLKYDPNATNKRSATLRGDLLPYSTNSFNLGSSSYQWNNLYAKNYYYNGTAWGLDKANTWSANNKFTGNITIEKNSSSPTTLSDTSLAFNESSNYIFFRTKGSSNFKSYNSWLWGGYQGPGYSGEERMGHLKIYRASAVYGETGEETPDTSFSFIDVALHYKKVNITDNVSFKNDGTTNACYPAYNNATDLGTTDCKWKTLNGINPGALSLPDYSRILNIDTTNWSKTVGQNNYTPAFDGWLQITIPNDTYGNGEKSNFITIIDSGFDPFTGITASDSKDYRIQITFPVVANHEYYIYIKSYSQTIMAARLIKCLGNVV